MGRYVFKADKDEDFYVEWSTVVDHWVTAGTREEMYEDFGIDEERLVRADLYGSSSYHQDGRWDDEYLMIHNMDREFYEKYDVEDRDFAWLLPRKNLRDYVDLTSDDSEVKDLQAIRDLLVIELH